MNNSTYSIYPNRYWRIILHILFWGIVLFLNYGIHRLLTLDQEYFNGIKLKNYLPFLAIAIGNHYIFCYVLLPLFKINTVNKFLPLLLTAILYLTSYIGANWSLFLLAKHHPDNQLLQAWKTNFYSSDWTAIFTRTGFRLILSFVLNNNLISIGLKIGIDYYASERDRLRMQKEQNSIETALLRTRIRPNFLLKHLDYLQKTVVDNPQASKALERLTHLMRFSIYESRKPQISLKEEVTFLQNYIDLERLRHREERVQLTFDYPEQLSNSRIKPLILINLVENAFKHGVNASAGKAYVAIRLEEKDQRLFFRVTNSKPAVQSPDREQKQGGIGLNNLKRRLELEYPGQHNLIIREDDTTFEAELILELIPAS